MLAQLTISNFAIVRELEIDFQSGMTAITGETGAGKSIAIDALGLCLGGRAEADMVRQGASRADLCARFSLKDTPAALRWLEENQLEDGSECLLRRAISSDGRSRGFINGTAVPLSQLRELGQLLIQIHGQHAHQLLLKPEHQKTLLDGYAGETALTQQMSAAYRQWHQSCRDLALHQQLSQERAARAELLHYQLKELNDFNPQAGEFEQIDEEYKRLANSGQLLSTSQQALHLLADGEDANLQSQLYSVRNLVTELIGMDEKLSGVLDMLEEAAIQITEASDELRHYCDRLDLDPNRLYELEQRISRQINLARKHHIAPEELPAFHQKLLDEQQQLDDQADCLETLTLAVNNHHQQAMKVARQLHESRVAYARELSGLITESMHSLSMPHGKLTIDVAFEENHLTAEGADRIDFRVSTNPGQPLQPLAKVASGGELSRIALAIQVITARKMETPALIFDEVDVGISGPTAAVVGKLLRQLGESTQVMCVTHLPQVAGCGHHHFFVSKETDGAMTETHMQPLDKRARLQELARLLGGSEVTRNTLANAKELLAA
ncbi:DNA repair protein RecN [Franconibacter pulveris 1160]|uniref:DNA repair protein RecN n=2 Tax=Franconibacter TaxID=1649295 RepID=C1IG72_9ENTR|nr:MULTISPECIES: DNA repair protein RecN [Franconibacter]ACE74850.1 RecN [Franconibacter pulveris]ACE74852.1 RecN [Franconibacter pulveris]ACE74854.1 RecN [Franconibacter pulveris]ACE74855.1 RecN [Franconibacter pulveris]KMV35394.1 recombination and repair protein [Franconibacter pulveris]